MKKVRITVCRFCGGKEFITAFQTGYGSLESAESLFKFSKIYHTICRDCGSVLRSYVVDPEKLLKRKERRKEDEE